MAKYANRLEEKKAWDKRQREGAKKYQEKRKKKLLTVKKKSPVLKPIISRPKTVYKIKKVSKKEAERLRAYHKQKREMMKDPANQICQWPGCEEPSTDCHHGKGRVGRYLKSGLSFCADSIIYTPNFIQKRQKKKEYHSQDLTKLF